MTCTQHNSEEHDVWRDPIHRLIGPRDESTGGAFAAESGRQGVHSVRWSSPSTVVRNASVCPG